ncbi:MAG: hypothetical protein E6K19_08425, partial [Methanobacteriota archaeon]
MTTADAYLADVRRAMAGMSTAVREDILRELRGHLAESAAANGGNVDASVAALGPAKEVGRRYRDLYGYGTGYTVLFAAISFLLAVPSIPVLVVGAESLFPFVLSIPFVIGAAAWILWVSVRAGTRAGVVSGVAGMTGRLAAFGVVALTQPGADVTVVGLGTLFA